MGLFSKLNPFNPIDPAGLVSDKLPGLPGLPGSGGLLGGESGGYQLYPSSKIVGGKLGQWADSANAKYNDVMQKQQAFNAAMASGDRSKIESAARDYETAGKGAVRDLGGNIKTTIRNNPGLSGYGMTAKITGSDRAARFLDPVGDVGVNDVAQGRNVFQSLQRTMGANQRDITDTSGEIGTLLGEGDNPDGFFGGLKGWGENLSLAEKKNLGAQSTAHQQVKRGDISTGFNTGYEGQKEFWNNRNVQSAVAVAASMGTAAAMAPYLASTLGLSNAAAMALANGIVNGAVTTASTGSLSEGLKTGAAAGLGGYAASYLPNMGSNWANAAARGGTSNAVSQLVQTGKIKPEDVLISAGTAGIARGVGDEYGRTAGRAAGGLVSGAARNGSEGAMRGGVTGLLGGQFGNLGTTAANLYFNNQRPNIANNQVNQAQNQPAGGYNPQQLSRLYAQYKARG